MLKVYYYREHKANDDCVVLVGYLEPDTILLASVVALLSVKKLGKNGRDVIRLVAEHLRSKHKRLLKVVYQSFINRNYTVFCLQNLQSSVRAKLNPMYHVHFCHVNIQFIDRLNTPYEEAIALEVPRFTDYQYDHWSMQDRFDYLLRNYT